MQEKDQANGGTGFPACAQENELSISRRNLPHWQLPGSTYFVTFRLKSGIMSDDEKTIVLNAIKHFHKIRYWVTTTIVMPDHVHILFKPMVLRANKDNPMSKILQSLKGYSAWAINKLRGTKGAIWLDESYDRIMRDYDEYLEKWNYIRNNPVKAGLCQAPEEYRFLWEPGEYEEDSRSTA